ncbi:hypothetical protein DNK48_18365 [Streptomyces malaysiensis subsp. malaysiensis]|uniref:hypothetical protein n=1 Tax=Streptomyces malaysiensis TaxID=92644 RepID=UPI000BFBCA01|nr:hypothetical protein [Streptomyces malaysiensis]QDL71034.1 hypothetical protein DNK48_18365 [Streptomyces malaysiensis]
MTFEIHTATGGEAEALRRLQGQVMVDMDRAAAEAAAHPAELLAAAVPRHRSRGGTGTAHGAAPKLTRLVFLGRTSTEDKQDPTISLPRQVRSCQTALQPGVVIVGFYYDVESGRKDLAARTRARP